MIGLAQRSSIGLRRDMLKQTINRRELIAGGTALAMGAALPGNAQAKEAKIQNPLVLQRADPQILRHGGDFYFTASVPEYDRIVLRRAKTVAGLKDARETVIWRRPANGKMAGYIWAPEIHHFDGKWHF